MPTGNIVLLHGAVNTSNFGDVLFVNLFYDSVIEHGDTPTFVSKGPFKISEFNIKELRQRYNSINNFEITFESISKANCLLLISGGYFGDNKKSLISSLRRWIRYFSVGLYFVFKKKPIYILGVGGAPLHSWFNRLSAKVIMNHAAVISVRDEDTANYFSSLGVHKPIRVTADTALAITSDMLPEFSELHIFSEYVKGRHSVLIHLTGSTGLDDRINRVIIPDLIKFLREDKNTCVILSYDYKIRKKIEDTSVYSSLKDFSPYVYHYDSAMQLCSLISKVDTVVTTKLHVGILGCAMSRSVLSFPMHKYKTKRFYQRIGYEDRCVSFYDLREGQIFDMLKRYHCVPVIVTNEIRELAKKNLEYL